MSSHRPPEAGARAARGRFRLSPLFLLLCLALIGCARAEPSAAATPATSAPPRPAAPALAGPPVQGAYDIGSPTLSELWVDPQHGDNGRSGASRDQALATIGEAWRRIPQGQPLQNTGYRINLVAGDYPDDTFPHYWEERHGTQQFPILLSSADGPGAARLLGNMNVFAVDHLYLLGLRIENAGDVFHCEQCSYLLIRDSVLASSGRQAQETLKVNQSHHIYIEGSAIGGSHDNSVDFVGVQYGHILDSRIYDAQDWCLYLKGGSAYFTVAGNEIYDCGTGGFTAGQGTGFEFMVAPWLHYEAYAIQFYNNVIHDTEGAGFGVNGGYDILLAYNTLYRVGSRSHGLEFVFGGRGCDGDSATCAAHRALGGWGSSVVGSDEPIPNRNVFVYNNLLYNPPGFRSQWQHFAIYGPRTPGAGTGIPNPARTDDTLQIRGNLIWNGPADLPLGIEGDDQGCLPANPTCNPTQLRADNRINQVQPSLIDPAGGDFRPTPGSLAGIVALPLPPFPAWDPFTPAVPAGELTPVVLTDRAGRPRPANGPPGAYVDPATTPTSRTIFLPALVVAARRAP